MSRRLLGRGRPSRRALEAMLRAGGTPEPPPGLAARIKEEIPEDLAAGAEEEDLPRPAPSRRRGPWILAASLAAALGGGVVAYRTLYPGSVSAPVPREVRSAQEANASTPPGAEGPTGAEGVAAKAQPPAGAGFAGGATPTEKRRAARAAPPAPVAPPAADEDRERAALLAKEAPRPELGAPSAELRTSAAEVAETKGDEGRLADRRSSEEKVTAPVAEGAPLSSRPGPEAAERSFDEALAAPAAAAPVAGSRDASAARADEGRGEERKLAATRQAAPRLQRTAAGTAAEASAGVRVGLSSGGLAAGGGFVDATGAPRSTFDLDVGLASYDEVRRLLEAGRLPPAAAVRVEELVNAFGGGASPPPAGEDFALAAEGAPAPFAGGAGSQLLRFAVQARAAARDAAGAPGSEADARGGRELVATRARVEVDFDPAVVARWRLLGSGEGGSGGAPAGEPAVASAGGFGDAAEARAAEAPSADLHAGQRVTALYEVELREPPAGGSPGAGRPVATLRLRYRTASGDEVREVVRTLRTGDLAPSWVSASPAFRVASLAAELGQVLQGAPESRGVDPGELFRRAERLAAELPGDARAADLAVLAGEAAQLLGSGGGP